ncbi:GNAT family N-acetyltransferase [Leifsonia sp. 21MFCrub1.1]|uniref:GNAT family N-acetyltransferase n=1 Tax=Leifsonia sp. 21MFCrub1.1 TaxID=1798223 RepID=UPI0008929EFB|nr:GNAT family N-acetyltransferase [Leifsonia sp. 21MFCrub1.1]SEA62619.1 FR47-like protein [Leifsonia sp. 21MFCrub1.1]
MKAEAEARVDTYWAEVFDVDVARIWEPGIHTTWARDPWPGVYVLVRPGVVRLRAPDRSRAELEPILQTVGGADALDVDRWQRVLGAFSPRILGPAIHSYRGDGLPVDGAGIEPVSGVEVLAFSREVGDAEFEESGLADASRMFGVRADGRLAAVSGLSDWMGQPSDIGVLTLPGLRGRGHGRRVAAAAVNDAIATAGIARWRSLAGNTASRSLARSLGFEDRGENIGIRLTL